MAFITITPPSVGDPMIEIWDLLLNDEYLYEKITGVEDVEAIENQSLELDVDSDGTPDGWRIRLYDGGVTSIADGAHGSKCLSVYSPGGNSKGGCVLETKDFVPTKKTVILAFRWMMKATNAKMNFRAYAVFYTASKTVISTHELYRDTTANPTSWATRGAKVTSPATAKFYKLFFDIAFPGGLQGTISIDNINHFVPYQHNTQILYTAGAVSLTIPDNVLAINVIAIGAGGGGGGGNTIYVPKVDKIVDYHYGAGGGGGGACCWGTFQVVPGKTYTGIVGTGGSGGAKGVIGTDGGNTYITDLFTCPGGKGGVDGNRGGNTSVNAGGAAGAFTWTDEVMGLTAYGGADGTKQSDQVVLGTTFRLPTGGNGGYARTPAQFVSTKGTGGAMGISGTNIIHSKPKNGTGYGSGGGGSAYNDAGGNGSNGILVVRY